MCVGGTSSATTLAKPKIVTIALTASVEIVEDFAGILCSNIAEGDTLTATYTYVTGATDTNESEFVGDYQYLAPPNGIRVDLGDQVTETDQSNVNFSVEVVNDFPEDGSDAFLLISNVNTPLPCGSPIDVIDWQLDDPTGKAFKNTALPGSAPKLADFESVCLVWRSEVP
jgi:hypothetical protein